MSSQGGAFCTTQPARVAVLGVSKNAMPVLISKGGAIVPPTGVLGLKTKVECKTAEFRVVPVIGLLKCRSKLPSAWGPLVVTCVAIVGAMMFKLLCPPVVGTPHESMVAEGVPKVPLLVTPVLGK